MATINKEESEAIWELMYQAMQVVENDNNGYLPQVTSLAEAIGKAKNIIHRIVGETNG